jgi:S1-C subfamily serine protease
MGPALPAAVVQVDKWQEHLLEGKDIALLKVPGHHLPTVKLGNAWDLEIGEPLVHIGQPEDALERLNLI